MLDRSKDKHGNYQYANADMWWWDILIDETVYSIRDGWLDIVL